MLLRFEVSNHRSIHEPIELSMIAVDRDRPSTRRFEVLNEQVLTVAGIYGPNASGKSNVVDALAWLSNAVGRSLRAWDVIVPRDPFRFAGGPSEPSTFDVELIVDHVRYHYSLEVDDDAVVLEALFSYPLRKQRTLFERDGANLNVRRELGSLAGTRELLTPTTLVLSAASRLHEPELRAVAQAISGIQTLVPHRRRPGPRFGLDPAHYFSTARLFDRQHEPSLFDDVDLGQPDDRESALALLRLADLGIDDVQVVEEPARDSAIGREPRRVLQFIHRATDEEIALPINEESDGTRTWFRLIGPVLSTLRRGQILLFDEIDASLHPRLSARLIELFQDPETNPRDAQLIFTSHDTSLLNHLNRDEVWLTEKGKDCATTLIALAEYGGDKVRRSLNLEKAYLQGRFGAVPEVDQYVLRRALGLTQDN
jgi:predicted ATPase